MGMIVGKYQCRRAWYDEMRDFCENLTKSKLPLNNHYFLSPDCLDSETLRYPGVCCRSRQLGEYGNGSMVLFILGFSHPLASSSP